MPSISSNWDAPGSLTLLARKSQALSDGLHLSNSRLMHTVGWSDLETTTGRPHGPLVNGCHTLERRIGLQPRETAHVILVGDISEFEFDLIPGGSYDSDTGLRFEDVVSTCVLRRPRHVAFRDSWTRQLLSLSYIFDAALNNDKLVGARSHHFVDFEAQTVRISHKFVSDRRGPSTCFKSLEPTAVGLEAERHWHFSAARSRSYQPDEWGITDGNVFSEIKCWEGACTDRQTGLRLLPAYLPGMDIPIMPRRYDMLKGALVEVALKITDHTSTLPSGRRAHEFDAVVERMTILQESSYHPFTSRVITDSILMC